MTVDAFWDWAVACYRRAGVQQHLLLLQDTQDLVILEALFACWLASHDRQCSLMTCGRWLSRRAHGLMKWFCRSELPERDGRAMQT